MAGGCRACRNGIRERSIDEGKRQSILEKKWEKAEGLEM